MIAIVLYMEGSICLGMGSYLERMNRKHAIEDFFLKISIHEREARWFLCTGDFVPFFHVREVE